MTHAEATSQDRAGRQSACGGLLTRRGDFEDVVYRDGRADRRTVSVLTCECGSILSLTGAGEVLNVYRWPELVARLPAAVGAGRGGGP